MLSRHNSRLPLLMEGPDGARGDHSAELGDIKTFYDSVYYSTPPAKDPGLRRHYRRLYRRLGIGHAPAVLDVACGTGEWLQVCREQGAQIAGVDLSGKAIEVCKAAMPDSRFFAQPAETLPFSDDEFDVVTCLGSLEHFVDPVSSIKEMVRVAREGACFVFLVPNADFLTRRLRLFNGTQQTSAKEVVRTIDAWEALFAGGGVNVDECWRDLHTVNLKWIRSGPVYAWPARAIQSLMLLVWPLRWQYQIYFRGSSIAIKQDS